MGDLYQRRTEWVDAGHALNIFKIFHIIPIVHGLGQIDCKLIKDDMKYCKLLSKNGSTGSDDNSISEFSEHSMISYLWILGAYEVIRSIDERVDKNRGGNPNILGEILNNKVKEVKKKFERIRIPLAKFEPARAHEETDFDFAYPHIHKSLGISWQVSDNIIIPRKELSDDLLNILLTIHSQNKESCQDN